jgi:hypothetical protein
MWRERDQSFAAIQKIAKSIFNLWVCRSRATQTLFAMREHLFSLPKRFWYCSVEAQACGTPVIAFGKGRS